MMNKKNIYNKAIAEQAANWVVLMDEEELSPKQNQKFTNWLRQSPLHINEFLNACILFDAIAHIDKYKTILITLDEKNITELVPSENNKKTDRVQVGITKRDYWLRISAVAALLIITFGLLFTSETFFYSPFTNTKELYSTRIGEQRSVVLSDDSIVFLNTQTKITVDFKDKFRDIILENGEATFQVSHDENRPLRVWTNKAMVQAIGTEFNVRDDYGATKVTVITGKVAVLNDSNGLANLADQDPTSQTGSDWLKNAIILVKGQGTSVNNRDKQATSFNANLEKTLSWRERKLIFSGESLEEVVQEFNRYNIMQITIEDKTVAKLPISAIFEANSPMSLLDFLALSGKVNVNKINSNKTVLSSK